MEWEQAVKRGDLSDPTTDPVSEALIQQLLPMAAEYSDLAAVESVAIAGGLLARAESWIEADPTEIDMLLAEGTAVAAREVSPEFANPETSGLMAILALMTQHPDHPTEMAGFAPLHNFIVLQPSYQRLNHVREYMERLDSFFAELPSFSDEQQATFDRSCRKACHMGVLVGLLTVLDRLPSSGLAILEPH